jgi:hypothetical protein
LGRRAWRKRIRVAAIAGVVHIREKQKSFDFESAG